MSLGSLAAGAGAAASAFSGILDTDLSKIAGLKTMNKKDFLDTLESLETDQEAKFTDYEDWDENVEEIKQDDAFNALLGDWTFMNKLMVKQIQGVQTYYLPIGNLAAGPYSELPIKNGQVPNFETLKKLVGDPGEPGDLALIYVPWSELIANY